MRKNILLFILALALTLLLAPYFGSFYNKLVPQYDNSFIGLSQNTVIFIAGIPFAYIFFTTILFQLFGAGNKKKWTLWLLAPAFLFFLSGDLRHIYLPIILAIIGFIITRFVNFIRFKSHQPNNQ